MFVEPQTEEERKEKEKVEKKMRWMLDIDREKKSVEGCCRM